MKLKNKLIIIFIVLLIIIIFSIYQFFYKGIQKKNKYDLNFEEVGEREYYLLFDNKYGVINKKGEIIIDANFDIIQIPNPSKDIFICMNNYDVTTGNYETKIYNKDKQEVLTNYEKVEAIKREENLDNIPYEKSILKYKENGKYGLINFEGKKITNPIYEDIQALEYKEGMLIVKKDGKFGVININGEIIINIKYDNIQSDQYSINEYHNKKTGFIVSTKTKEGYRYGYINYKGEELLKTKYNEIERINNIKNDENIYLVALKDGQAGLYKNKTIILKHEYEDIQFDNINNLVIVQKNSKQGVLNLIGDSIIPIEYTNIIIAGNYINAQKEDEVIIFDNKGIKLENNNFISVISTENDKYFVSIDKDENYGIVDKENNVLIENKYTFINYLFDDYFIAQNDTKIGIIDVNNKLVQEFKYDALQKIEKTNLIKAIKGEDTQIINKNMNIIASMENAQLEITDNYMKLYNSKNRKYYDYDGNEIDNISNVINQKIYAKKQNNKWGFVLENGNVKINFKYDMVTEFNTYGYAGIKIKDKWGVIDLEGNVLQEPIYTLDEIEPEFIGKYYKKDLGYGEVFYTNE